MDIATKDVLLHVAGMLAILTALAHGVIAELSVFPRARIEPRRVRNLLRLIWQASTIDWIALGVLLIVAPTLVSDTARRWIAVAAIVVYGFAAIGNALASRGRHVDWVLMCAVVALAWMGA